MSESNIEYKNKDKLFKACENRLLIIFCVVAMLLSLLAIRLFYIQIINGENLRSKAINQWFNVIETISERGTIYDRKGVPLTNKVRENYLVIKGNSTEIKESIPIISSLTEIDEEQVKKNIINNQNIIKLPIKNYDANKIKEILRNKGVAIIEMAQRYDEKSLASHIIGYINKFENTGQSGLEKNFDMELKDSRVIKIGAIVDAKKRVLPGMGYIVNESNEDAKKNINTTLDYDIQKICEKVIDKKKLDGSIVVLDSETGEILSMVSRPNFNQNNLGAHLDSNNQELYNKAIQLSYPPGSIFKIVVAATVLEEKLFDIDDTFICNGYETLGDNVIKCHSYEKGGHGEITLEEAFTYSCNSAFIQMGQHLGGEKLLEMTKGFGLGYKTGIKIAEEIKGNLPSVDYVKGAGIGNFSIGQGTLETTPLQVARLTNIIANDGIDVGVKLVKSISKNDGEIIEQFEDENINRVISRGTANKIKKMMELVVDEGTGKRAKIDGIEAAGKTGSAEAVNGGEETVHAWFTGYFLGQKSKYVVTIIVEDKGSGGRAAAPLFGEIASRMVKKQL